MSNEYTTIGDGIKIGISFDLQLLVVDAETLSMNKDKFKVYGEEYDVVPGGKLISKVYNVVDVIKHPLVANSISLIFDVKGSFRNVQGPLTVEYVGGNIGGNGGPVTPFATTFYPEGLILKPSPNDLERVELININGLLKRTMLTKVYTNNGNENVVLRGIIANATRTAIDDI